MEFFNQAIDILKILVMALGAGLAVWGVINLLEGYGSDNPAAKSQGISGHPGHRIEHYHISGSQNPVELQPFRAGDGCTGVSFLHDMGSRVFCLDIADLAVNALFCSRNSAIAINAHNSFLSVSKIPNVILALPIC